MLKYLKYYIPGISCILAIAMFSMGEYYPTIYLILFSLFLILGDIFFEKDTKVQKFSYPFLLDLSMYVNLPILFALILFIVSIFSSDLSFWYIDFLKSIVLVDIQNLHNSFNIIDKISLVIQTGLFVGMIAIIPGHELTHRKKNKFDMLIGNWLLAFSWDCTFAIEHVYGHHKNVCLPEDPASAKRGENIYLFIVRSIFQEQIDGWKIERDRLSRRGYYFFSFRNKMIIGHLRSVFLSLIFFIIGGIKGFAVFLLFAFIGKVLLEAINYIEHYGLVRERGKPVCLRHSWNSNHKISSLYLCNVTRHSDHHRASNLKFWELSPSDADAPVLPYGYLGMLYLLLFIPFLYHRVMAKKIKEWDLNFANKEELKLADIQNKNSGLSALNG